MFIWSCITEQHAACSLSKETGRKAGPTGSASASGKSVAPLRGCPQYILPPPDCAGLRGAPGWAQYMWQLSQHSEQACQWHDAAPGWDAGAAEWMERARWSPAALRCRSPRSRGSRRRGRPALPRSSGPAGLSAAPRLHQRGLHRMSPIPLQGIQTVRPIPCIMHAQKIWMIRTSYKLSHPAWSKGQGLLKLSASPCSPLPACSWRTKPL